MDYRSGFGNKHQVVKRNVVMSIESSKCKSSPCQVLKILKMVTIIGNYVNLKVWIKVEFKLYLYFCTNKKYILISIKEYFWIIALKKLAHYPKTITTFLITDRFLVTIFENRFGNPLPFLLLPLGNDHRIVTKTVTAEMTRVIMRPVDL